MSRNSDDEWAVAFSGDNDIVFRSDRRRDAVHFAFCTPVTRERRGRFYLYRSTDGTEAWIGRLRDFKEAGFRDTTFRHMGEVLDARARSAGPSPERASK